MLLFQSTNILRLTQEAISMAEAVISKNPNPVPVIIWYDYI